MSEPDDGYPRGPAATSDSPPGGRVVQAARNALETFLSYAVISLMVAMVTVVVLAVVYRKLGNSLSWYDEIASILLAWLTYYGSALAALKRAHIGFAGFVDAIPPPFKLVVVAFGEVCVLGFFALLTWVGWEVVLVLEGDTLVSLPEVSTQITQSVIPVGGLLFVLAQLLSLPETWRLAKAGQHYVHEAA